jgi:hypothetical protein
LITAAVIACGTSFASAPIYKAAAPKSLMCPAYDYGIQLGSSGTNQSQYNDSGTGPQGAGFYASKDCVRISALFSALKQNQDDITDSGSTTAGQDFTLYSAVFELAYVKPITQSTGAGLGLSYGRKTSTDDTATGIDAAPYDVALKVLVSQKLSDRLSLGYSFPLVRYMNNGQSKNTSVTNQKETHIDFFGMINSGGVSIRYSLA